METVGDEYMCVSGIPTQNKEHAYRAAMLALDMITAVEEAREIVHAGSEDAEEEGAGGEEERPGLQH